MERLRIFQRVLRHTDFSNNKINMVNLVVIIQSNIIIKIFKQDKILILEILIK